MNESITGGPAFPNWVGNHYTDQRPHGGMTLRDYFAAKAMQGIYAHDADSYDFEGVAKAAFKTADAMIKARAL